MKAVELYNYLHNIIKEHGNCEIYHWDGTLMKYVKLSYAKLINQNDFNQNFKDDKEYSDNFQEILDNIVLT